MKLYILFIARSVISYTVWCPINMVKFLQNIHKRHPIARPLRWDMGCLFWEVRLWLIFCLYSWSDACNIMLTHCGWVTHICISKLAIIGSDQATSHYLNQWWNIVNWNLTNTSQWNLNRNSYIFIQENAFENVICEMAAILSQPQCVKLDQLITALDYIIGTVPVKQTWSI